YTVRQTVRSRPDQGLRNARCRRAGKRQAGRYQGDHRGELSPAALAQPRASQTPRRWRLTLAIPIHRSRLWAVFFCPLIRRNPRVFRGSTRTEIVGFRKSSAADQFPCGRNFATKRSDEWRPFVDPTIVSTAATALRSDLPDIAKVMSHWRLH